MRLIHVMLASSLALIIWGMKCSLGATSKVVLFDNQAIQGQLIRQLAQHQASEEQVARISYHFKGALNQILKEYALRHDAVILERPSVLAGGTDITNEISNELSRVMGKK
jgi:conjugal transfer pilin signal peptidase TrbI